MHGQMPQEIEVWYIIPALRRELAKSMIKLELTQKQIAKIMGITEAAVSQYIHSKRAKEVVFSNAILEEIKKSAKKIADNSNLLIPEMMKLTQLTDVKQVMCDMHKKQDANMPTNCDCCFEEDIVKLK
tara:strand:- start:566 stop:949 length:384 start_codon:yes stop_codon:yes gene_type:complete